MTARLGVTGSRLLTWERHEDAIARGLIHAGRILGRDTVLVHGDCRPATRSLRGVKLWTEGADYLADLCWKHWGLPVEPHPADWGRVGVGAGFARNVEMAELGADLWLAWPYPDLDVPSRGTWHMVRQCLNRSQKVINGWTLEPIMNLPRKP